MTNIQLYEDKPLTIPEEVKAAYLEIKFKSGYTQVSIVLEELADEALSDFADGEHIFVPVPLHPFYLGDALNGTEIYYVHALVPAELIEDITKYDELPEGSQLSGATV